MNCLRLVVAIFLVTAIKTYGQKLLPYQNSRLPLEQRVEDLVERMTMEEKFWQLFMIPEDFDKIDLKKLDKGIFGLQARGSADSAENALTLAKKVNRIQKFFVEETRLGIPVVIFEEALHGVVRPGATAFPQSIGLAATFNTQLMHEIAAAIAKETKVRGIRDVLSPVINIANDVRWGRTEESYGEDPLLSAEMGLAFVSEFEKMGIITTPKHFIANVGDGGRDSYPIHFNERLLREVHLPPFLSVIKDGNAHSIMTSYNSVDGQSAGSNSWLMNDVLKSEWEFDGFVITDANALGGDVVLHYTAENSSVAGARAISNGMDVIFQTSYNHHRSFIRPFLENEIDEDRINDAVKRVLRAKMEIGLFENPYVDEKEAANWIDNKHHKKLARQAARESVVLLKNENNLLPLKKDLKTIAVIGEDAIEGRLGGYSGPGNGVVTILNGIRNTVSGETNVLFHTGPGKRTEEWKVISSEFLSNNQNGQKTEGLQGEYFNNLMMKGKPEVVRVDPRVNFKWTLNSPARNINLDFYSVRWTGTLSSPVDGVYKIGLKGNDGFRLYLENELIVDNWEKTSFHTVLTDFHFEKGKSYDIRIEFFEPIGNAEVRLIWNYDVDDNWEEKINSAVELARKADVVIVVPGIIEAEFQDRAMLNLPGHQEQLIREISRTGKPMVVLLSGGSAITINNWMDLADGILAIWYPGEEGGNAIADILFGNYNPAGRLPITFPIHEAQLPLVYNHKPTGRGDDYNNLTGLPLFPFGFGLSYSHFEYENLYFETDTINSEESVKVSFDLVNESSLEGEEVVQLYIRDLLASVSRPVMELKDFQRVKVIPGSTTRIEFTITPEMLKMLNKDMEEVIEPGEFRIMIGASSRDIRLKGTLTVR